MRKLKKRNKWLIKSNNFNSKTQEMKSGSLVKKNY